MYLLGHTVTEIAVTDNLDTLFADEYYILLYDFKAEINHYLSNTPKEVKLKSLEALINFNSQNKEKQKCPTSDKIYLLSRRQSLI
ncbi:hypothetical protein ACOBV8_19760 (plasmid) [Pseudoalteromonas espejiana]